MAWRWPTWRRVRRLTAPLGLLRLVGCEPTVGPAPAPPPLPTGPRRATIDEPGLGPAPEPVRAPRPAAQLSADEAWLQEAINQLRLTSGLNPLAPDGLLQARATVEAAAWAARLGSGDEPAELDLEALRKEMPEAFTLAWQEWAARSVNGLAEDLAEAELVLDPTMTHVGLGVAAADSERAWVAFALVAQTVPELTGEALDRGERLVYTTCSFCHESQYLEITLGLNDQAGTLNAVCRTCGRKYDSFAQDTVGKFHRPSRYCEEFNPKPLDSPSKIWLRALMRVAYEVDQERYGRLDVWQRAGQTWDLRRGDCEDSALLIADWLRANGFDAKVVIGVAEGEGHAWVVLHADGQDYLLEGTGGEAAYHRVPPRASALPDYFPEAQFDPSGMWYRKDKGWTADYRDPAAWGPGPADR